MTGHPEVEALSGDFDEGLFARWLSDSEPAKTNDASAPCWDMHSLPNPSASLPADPANFNCGPVQTSWDSTQSVALAPEQNRNWHIEESMHFEQHGAGHERQSPTSNEAVLIQQTSNRDVLAQEQNFDGNCAAATQQITNATQQSEWQSAIPDSLCLPGSMHQPRPAHWDAAHTMDSSPAFDPEAFQLHSPQNSLPSTQRGSQRTSSMAAEHMPEWLRAKMSKIDNAQISQSSFQQEPASVARPSTCHTSSVLPQTQSGGGSQNGGGAPQVAAPCVNVRPSFQDGNVPQLRPAMPLLPVHPPQGSLVFCSHIWDPNGMASKPSGFAINHFFTQKYNQLTAGERSGQALAHLMAQATQIGLFPMTLAPPLFLSQAPTARHTPHAGAPAPPGHPVECCESIHKTVAPAEVLEEEDQSPGESPRKQASGSGQDSANSQRRQEGSPQALEAKASVVGHASSRKSESGKLTVIFRPKDSETRAKMEEAQLNPTLELTCRAKKEFAQVLNHLQRKWAAACPGVMWPEGAQALRLYPSESKPIFMGACWGPPHCLGGLSLSDVHVAMGKQDVLELRYRWDTVSLSQAQSIAVSKDPLPQEPRPTAGVPQMVQQPPQQQSVITLQANKGNYQVNGAKTLPKAARLQRPEEFLTPLPSERLHRSLGPSRMSQSTPLLAKLPQKGHSSVAQRGSVAPMGAEQTPSHATGEGPVVMRPGTHCSQTQTPGSSLQRRKDGPQPVPVRRESLHHSCLRQAAVEAGLASAALQTARQTDAQTPRVLTSMGPPNSASLTHGNRAAQLTSAVDTSQPSVKPQQTGQSWSKQSAKQMVSVPAKKISLKVDKENQGCAPSADTPQAATQQQQSGRIMLILQENNIQRTSEPAKQPNANVLTDCASKPKRKYTRRKKPAARAKKVAPKRGPAAKKQAQAGVETEQEPPGEEESSDCESGEIDDPDAMDFEIAQALSEQFAGEGPIAGRTTRAKKQQQAEQRKKPARGRGKTAGGRPKSANTEVTLNANTPVDQEPETQAVQTSSQAVIDELQPKDVRSQAGIKRCAEGSTGWTPDPKQPHNEDKDGKEAAARARAQPVKKQLSFGSIAKDVSLQAKPSLQHAEDRTCDGFEKWTAFSKQKQQGSAADAPPVQMTVAIRPEGDNSLAEWSTLLESPPDHAPPCLQQNKQLQDEAECMTEHLAKLPDLDASLLPDDLAIDFEDFLNDEAFDFGGDLVI